MRQPKAGGWYRDTTQPGFIFWCIDAKPLPGIKTQSDWYEFRRYRLTLAGECIFEGCCSQPFTALWRAMESLR